MPALNLCSARPVAWPAGLRLQCAHHNEVRGCDRPDHMVASRSKPRLGVRLSIALRAVGNPSAAGRQAAETQRERALLPALGYVA